jgi:hypothetical protein
MVKGDKMRVITLIVILLVLFTGVVYGAISATGSEKVDMNGQIIGICKEDSNNENYTQNSVLVQGIVTGNSKNQNISITITRDTDIAYKQGSEVKNASIDDLKSGQNVQVRFTGPIMQSYPPRIAASQIYILN